MEDFLQKYRYHATTVTNKKAFSSTWHEYDCCWERQLEEYCYEEMEIRKTCFGYYICKSTFSYANGRAFLSLKNKLLSIPCEQDNWLKDIKSQFYSIPVKELKNYGPYATLGEATVEVHNCCEVKIHY